MLCDDVIEDATRGFTKIVLQKAGIDLIPMLRAAQKFNFSPAASSIVNNMHEMKSESDADFKPYLIELNKSLEFFRVPYPLTWLEISRTEREKVAAVDKLRPLPPIDKLGFLIKSDSDGRKGEVYLFWRHKVKMKGCGIGMAVATTIFDFDDEYPPLCDAAQAFALALAAELKNGISEDLRFADPLLKHSRIMLTRFNKILENQHGEALAQNAILDWVGEIYLLYWAIITLNAKTGFTKTEMTPDAQLNKARFVRNKLPLLTYNEVDLSKKYRGALQENGDGGFKRLHWRRGHFKARKTGIFWWAAHMAGHKELGFAEKSYAV
jgi:hypothetical protein